jgi:peptidoglycan/LPS O-acetylase OafA/YrhL
MTLGEALSSGRSTNLDLLRLVLAACVIVSHAWPLALGAGTAEPLEQLTGHSLGGWALAVFFFMSGLLVTASAERRSHSDFWAARARRIFPGLGVALLVTLMLAFASGAETGGLAAVEWFFRALTLVSIEHRLAGAFDTAPMPGIVNGPLWSLFHEVAAYCLCWLCVATGVTRVKGAVVLLIAAAGAAALAAPGLPGRAETFAPLFCAFAIGMGAFVFRETLPLRPALALVALPLAVILPWPLAIAALAYACLAVMLSLPGSRLGGDYSFGLYIYGWPVAQTIVQASPGMSPALLAVLSLVATLPFAAASWHFVERNFQLRGRLAV